MLLPTNIWHIDSFRVAVSFESHNIINTKQLIMFLQSNSAYKGLITNSELLPKAAFVI